MEINAKEKMEMVMQMKKIALAKLVIPFFIAGATVLFFWFFVEPEVYAKYARVFSIYSFIPLVGTGAAIPEGLRLGIPPVALISFIIFTDAVLALFLVWNFDYAKKIPGLGKLVERAEENGEKAIRKYKWVKRFGFIGIVVLVIFPLQWTGAAVGSIVGRLIGMTPLMTLLAVVLGTFIRSTLIVYFSWLVTLLVKPFF
ncbi:MAG: small multi-drug export protein [Halobacteriota archaeon]